MFSVDLFNEGIDVPAVDTVLLLRPTESPTLFLQQLGRGLRKASGKAACTVLDFVGNHRREFRFDRRLRALLGGSRRSVEQAVRQGFPFLPAGCSMQLDEVATEIVLRSLRDALPTRWPAKVAELQSLPDVDLAGFLTESGLDLDDVYDGGHCWSDLQAAAGRTMLPPGPAEDVLRRAISRLLHIDDQERIQQYLRWLGAPTAPQVDLLGVPERRLLHMLVAQLLDRAVDKDASVQEGIDLLWRHPQVRAELLELLGVLGGRVDHLHAPLERPEGVPLQVHARYSRLEILAAMGRGREPRAKVPAWQSGVWEAKDARADLLAFTLDKSSGGFSPTTRYQDYAVTPSLIHWESQSSTRADSETGLRYRHHAERGWTILLFTRLRADDRAFWFLGPATYRGHTGEKPMAITWELASPLPGDLYAAFAAVVA